MKDKAGRLLSAVTCCLPCMGAGEHGSLLPTSLLGDEDVLCVEASSSYSTLKIFQGLLVDVRVSAYSEARRDTVLGTELQN